MSNTTNDTKSTPTGYLARGKLRLSNKKQLRDNVHEQLFWKWGEKEPLSVKRQLVKEPARYPYDDLLHQTLMHGDEYKTWLSQGDQGTTEGRRSALTEVERAYDHVDRLKRCRAATTIESMGNVLVPPSFL